MLYLTSMICYASHTGTKRNLAALKAAGWGLLVSRAGHGWYTAGFDDWCADNGAWSDFKADRPFDEDTYEGFLDWIATQSTPPNFLVLPDIVAGGERSLALSVRYMNRCAGAAPLLLIAVQDGMTADDLAPLVRPDIGIFLGGSTKWKLAMMDYWGRFCAERGIYYDVARVNTARRMYQAIAAGAHSIDGTSATRYAVTLPMLDSASRHRDLFSLRP